MGTLGGVPRQLLGGGRSPFTPWTPIAFRAQADIDSPAQDRQVPESERFIQAVELPNRAPTLATRGPSQRAFDRDRAVAPLVLLDLEYPDIRDIQRNGNLNANGCTLLLSFRSYDCLISRPTPHHHNILGSPRQLSKNRH